MNISKEGQDLAAREQQLLTTPSPPKLTSRPAKRLLAFLSESLSFINGWLITIVAFLGPIAIILGRHGLIVAVVYMASLIGWATLALVFWSRISKQVQ